MSAIRYVSGFRTQEGPYVLGNATCLHGGHLGLPEAV